MPINFDTYGTLGFSRPPRVINVVDANGGCPAANRTNPLIAATFTVATKSVIVIQGEIIRRRDDNSRCDAALYGPGYPNQVSDTIPGANNKLDVTINYNDGFNNEWGNNVLRWMGYVDAGTHTFYIGYRDDYAQCTSSWGCTADWGQINVIIFE